MINKLFFILFSIFLFNFISLPCEAQEINLKGIKFHINDDFLSKNTELVGLILRTESMNSEEKQYWFDILPTVDNSRIIRLYGILETERIKLLEIELKYQEEIKELNKKYLKDYKDTKKNRSKYKYVSPEKNQEVIK